MLCGLLLAAGAQGEIVSQPLPGGLSVSAEFHAGEAGRHAVLVLHGFMTTREFNTVQSLVNELTGSGYTVLAPTLSLGVDNRRATVPCDAIHTHTWEEDLAEIDFWVNWLVRQGYDSIVLLGHSSGSLQLVSYAAGAPPDQVKKVVATSLVNLSRYTSAAVAEREIAEAKKLLSKKPPPLREYHVVFCDNFTATPQSYLSYVRWTPERVLQTLTAAQVPVEVIMGGADRRFSADWIESLRKNGTKVMVIDGASHFFDATYEFDLLDKVHACLEETDS
ncbi:MAG: alpha/beta fold hydrolase [Gammaproteobacteria bacterium]|nr:alpha/beta fold hydrolase [Gammaproteobacteria bacterium]MCW8841515.1 alpha/beta fold hydrolase [Gammaproteobacteria bacterium]MCW8928452.1 alpha/beta fold hydrolase [Gammaproteobacteria bacterium]MCW8957420.1 alpha/beta fold hydrolase [Gammaproteobacteria bacterium]MCW8973668.1 alpha/beta fold hydrolase [Gammaproteobacteria bacterium]